ncbi:hypothetical protein FQN57_005224 [Myotisia sp. PD_48]|nr:hypothetical protein FQN57_005224 [Myotisia sp. PD_48]
MPGAEVQGTEMNGNNTMSDSNEANPNSTSVAQETGLSVEDILLPRSVITRLAKEMLPSGTGVQRDAITAMVKAATVFASYLSSHANEVTDKKTLTPQDVLAALSEVEFEAFRPRLEQHMKAYTELMENKRQQKKERKENPGKVKEASEGTKEPGTKRRKRDINIDDNKANHNTEDGDKQHATSDAIVGGRDYDAEVMEDTHMSNEEEGEGEEGEGEEEEGSDNEEEGEDEDEGEREDGHSMKRDGLEAIDDTDSDVERRRSRRGKHPDSLSSSGSDSDDL